MCLYVYISVCIYIYIHTCVVHGLSGSVAMSGSSLLVLNRRGQEPDEEDAEATDEEADAQEDGTSLWLIHPQGFKSYIIGGFLLSEVWVKFCFFF